MRGCDEGGELGDGAEMGAEEDRNGRALDATRDCRGDVSSLTMTASAWCSCCGAGRDGRSGWT